MTDAKSFLFSLPQKVDPSRIEGQHAIFHFDVTDEGQYTVKIDDGKLHVAEGFEGEADSTIKASTETFRRLLERDLNPMWAVTTGKLKITNIGRLMEYAKVFGLM